MITLEIEHTHGKCVYHGSAKAAIETHDALFLENVDQDTEHGLLVLTLTLRQRLDACFRADTHRQWSPKDSRETHTRLEDTLHCDRSTPFHVAEEMSTQAVLKQPPSAPAKAAPKGVSLMGLDCTDIVETLKSIVGQQG